MFSRPREWQKAEKVKLQITNLELSCFNILCDNLKKSFMCNFSHMTFSMSHVTCLNSTHGKSYNSTHNGLEKIVSNQFEAKLCPKSVQCNSIILGETNYELDFNLK